MMAYNMSGEEKLAKEFRVYMIDPEDRGNNQYFIKEIRRRV